MAKEKKIYMIISEPNPLHPEENFIHVEVFGFSDFQNLEWSQYGSLVPDNMHVSVTGTDQIANTGRINFTCSKNPRNNCSLPLSMDESRAQRAYFTFNSNGVWKKASVLCGVAEFSPERVQMQREVTALASRLLNVKFTANSENVQDNNRLLLSQVLEDLDNKDTEEQPNAE